MLILIHIFRAKILCPPKVDWAPTPMPNRNFVMPFFWNSVKCKLKIRIYHYASDKSCADFSLKMHQKSLAGARTRWGNLQCSPDLLAGFKIGERDKRRRKGEIQEGIDSWGRGTEERREGQEGRWDGREWGRMMDARISQGRPEAFLATRNASQKSLGNKNKIVVGQSLNLVCWFSGK